jgi:hypothetical protein
VNSLHVTILKVKTMWAGLHAGVHLALAGLRALLMHDCHITDHICTDFAAVATNLTRLDIGWHNGSSPGLAGLNALGSLDKLVSLDFRGWLPCASCIMAGSITRLTRLTCLALEEVAEKSECQVPPHAGEVSKNVVIEWAEQSFPRLRSLKWNWRFGTLSFKYSW